MAAPMVSARVRSHAPRIGCETRTLPARMPRTRDARTAHAAEAAPRPSSGSSLDEVALRAGRRREVRPAAAGHRLAGALRVPGPRDGAERRRQRGARPPPALGVLGRGGLGAEAEPAAWTRQIANAYLQGKESLAIAIARGRVRYDGDARCALLYVPALRPRGRALPASRPPQISAPARSEAARAAARRAPDAGRVRRARARVAK